MSATQDINLNQVQEILRKNANRSFKAMLHQLEQSPQGISFITPEVLFSSAAIASGVSQNIGLKALDRFNRSPRKAKLESIKDVDSPLYLAVLVSFMTPEIRSKTLTSMSEDMFKKVQSCHGKVLRMDNDNFSP